MKIQKNMHRLFWLTIVISICAMAIVFFPKGQFLSPEKIQAETLPVIPLEEAYPHVLERNTSLFTTLMDLNIPAAVIHEVVTAAKPVQDLSKLKPGIRFQVYFKGEQPKDVPEPQIVSAGEVDPESEVVTEHQPKNEPQDLIGIRFRFSAIDSLNITKISGGGWTAEKIVEPVDIKVMTYSGIVTSSLWESAQRAKMDPNLISELADIFAWEVDFAREVRLNDRWRLTVEQKIVKGEPIGWGAILAAEYENAGTSYQATLFRLNGEEVGYFTPQGASLRKMFLKSPIRYGRITSKFNMRRFHPILKTRRPHLGVDYGAPIGTPVRAVGDATVMSAGWSGGGGKVIKLRHNSQYQTAYKHLNGFAPGIRAGARVRQGQVIGYVGSTGLSTGPHLHFEFYNAGRYVDPLKKKFPSADPVPAANLEQFKAESSILLSGLPDWNSREISTVDATTNQNPDEKKQ
jgi:murein DD-endopeptidase MepM/ murein hydrolase activator NlpD